MKMSLAFDIISFLTGSVFHVLIVSIPIFLHVFPLSIFRSQPHASVKCFLCETEPLNFPTSTSSLLTNLNITIRILSFCGVFTLFKTNLFENCYLYLFSFLDAIASPSTYPGHWVSESVSESVSNVFRFWRLLSHLPSLRACFCVKLQQKNQQRTGLNILLQ